MCVFSEWSKGTGVYIYFSQLDMQLTEVGRKIFFLFYLRFSSWGPAELKLDWKQMDWQEWNTQELVNTCTTCTPAAHRDEGLRGVGGSGSCGIWTENRDLYRSDRTEEKDFEFLGWQTGDRRSQASSKQVCTWSPWCISGWRGSGAVLPGAGGTFVNPLPALRQTERWSEPLLLLLLLLLGCLRL